jgi:hypothetical protein
MAAAKDWKSTNHNANKKGGVAGRIWESWVTGPETIFSILRIEYRATVCCRVSGDSGAEGEEKRLANRSRSVTPAARATDGSYLEMRARELPSVTSAGFCEVKWGAVLGTQGRRAAPATKQKSALVTAVIINLL